MRRQSNLEGDPLYRDPETGGPVRDPLSPLEHRGRRSISISSNGNHNYHHVGGTGGGGVKPGAVPGRPRRKRAPGSKKGKKSFCYRFYAHWVRGTIPAFSSLFVPVLIWYSVGVISIGTSKVLLTHHVGRHIGSVPPLFLTLQQLLIGSTLLRFLLEIRFMGSSGVQPWPGAKGQGATERRRSYSDSKIQESLFDVIKNMHPSLVLTALFFAFGFLATNYGFSGAPASFVETIKASEPITSAAIAVLWGIEVLSQQEVISLGVIIAGVLLSTLGNGGDASASSSSVSTSLSACLVVMASNLCFSFRGLYQKLLRATPEGSPHAIDDINLQFRMQQIGVTLLAIPVLIFETPTICRDLWHLSTQHGILRTGVAWNYVGLALVNGVAFTSYNLASTYILSRISVVHHAALNCIRRVFAIIVTSILFSVPFTITGVLGIMFSIAGFMAFSHYKVQRQTQPKPLSSLLPISAVN